MHEPVARAALAPWITALTLALCTAGGCVRVGAVETGQIGPIPGGGYTDERDTVQMVSTVIGGKNVFIPSTVVLTQGSGRTLTIYNTADKPHGIRVPSLSVEAVLEPGVETVVALPPLEGGRIYDILCHLHPPHRHATLMVVRGN
jgi:hypothetical protein